MNLRQSKLYKPLLVALAVVLLVCVSKVQNVLNRDRATLGITKLEPLENAPPVLAFTTVALGSFRGLIANALWIRMNELQENDKYFEMVQLADWITKLEPHFVQVWLVQAWNMAYNVSVKFKDPADRWRWVQRGISLLRDDGLRFNPDEPLIYRELSWFFQHKMGQNLDDANLYYKTAWFREMYDVLGKKPNYGELLNPKTDEQRAKVKILRERYKMDPEVMKRVDTMYGPLEWRLPDAHAIYWADLGRLKAKKEEQDQLQRSIYQTMQQNFERGAVEENKIDGTISFRPNLDSVENVNKSYEEQMSSPDPSLRDIPKTGHKNFLRKVPYYAYLYNRQTEATKWFKYLKEKYPEAVPANMTLDNYVLKALEEVAGDTDAKQTAALVEGLLYSSYVDLASDEDDRSENYQRMALKIYQRYSLKTEGTGDRIKIPTLAEVKKSILDRLLDPEQGWPVEYANRLRTKLGLPAAGAITDPKVETPK